MFGGEHFKTVQYSAVAWLLFTTLRFIVRLSRRISVSVVEVAGEANAKKVAELLKILAALKLVTGTLERS